MLILSPTRELTVQTHKEINSILTGDLYAVVCYGGERARIQLEDIYKQVGIFPGYQYPRGTKTKTVSIN